MGSARATGNLRPVQTAVNVNDLKLALLPREMHQLALEDQSAKDGIVLKFANQILLESGTTKSHLQKSVDTFDAQSAILPRANYPLAQALETALGKSGPP